VIRTAFARLEWTPEGALSTFDDGTSWPAHVHDLPHYHAVAHRLGYEGDTLRYCREHELSHHLCAEHFGEPSRVLWGLAHDRMVDPLAAASEEALAMALQRYARTNEVPLIACVDWQALRTLFLTKLEEA